MILFDRTRPKEQDTLCNIPFRIPSDIITCTLTKYNATSDDRSHFIQGERGGSVVECRTPEREVRGSRPTAAVLCP